MSATKDVLGTRAIPPAETLRRNGHDGTAKRSPEVTPPKPLQPAILQPFLEKAADAESKQHYKMAASLYEQVESPEEAEQDLCA